MALPVITLATSWQSLGVAQAIASAINRRCAVCGMPAIAVPDNTVQVAAFIRSAQNALLSLAADGNWVDPLHDYGASIVMPVRLSDSAAFFAASPLNAEGAFRRLLNADSMPSDPLAYADAAFHYGPINDVGTSAPDFAGPWLFQDLVSALGFMTRRAYYADETAASDSWLNVSTPPSSSGSPSYSSSAGGQLIYCGKKNERYNDTTRQFRLSVQHGCHSLNLTGLPAVPVTARLLAQTATERRITAADGSYIDDTPSLLGYANGGAYQLDVASSSDGTVSIEGPSPLASWGVVESLVSWPPNPSGDWSATLTNNAYIFFNNPVALLDFVFD